MGMSRASTLRRDRKKYAHAQGLIQCNIGETVTRYLCILRYGSCAVQYCDKWLITRLNLFRPAEQDFWPHTPYTADSYTVRYYVPFICEPAVISVRRYLSAIKASGVNEGRLASRRVGILSAKPILSHSE